MSTIVMCCLRLCCDVYDCDVLSTVVLRCLRLCCVVYGCAAMSTIVMRCLRLCCDVYCLHLRCGVNDYAVVVAYPRPTISRSDVYFKTNDYATLKLLESPAGCQRGCRMSAELASPHPYRTSRKIIKFVPTRSRGRNELSLSLIRALQSVGRTSILKPTTYTSHNISHNAAFAHEPV